MTSLGAFHHALWSYNDPTKRGIMYLKALLLLLKNIHLIYPQQKYCHRIMTICMRTSAASLPPAENTVITFYHCASSVNDVACNLPQIWVRCQVTVTCRHAGLSRGLQPQLHPFKWAVLKSLQSLAFSIQLKDKGSTKAFFLQRINYQTNLLPPVKQSLAETRLGLNQYDYTRQGKTHKL